MNMTVNEVLSLIEKKTQIEFDRANISTEVDWIMKYDFIVQMDLYKSSNFMNDL